MSSVHLQAGDVLRSSTSLDTSRVQPRENIVPYGQYWTAYPDDPSDASNKQYVDDKIASVTYTAGDGLVLTDNVLSLDSDLSLVTSLGNLTSLSVIGPSSLHAVDVNGNVISNLALPVLPTDAASRAYVDSAYTAGTGLVKTGTTFSLGTTIGTLTTLTITDSAYVPYPTIAGQATNKSYVDNAYLAGTGLTKVGTTFSVNAQQAQITQIGTLSSLSVSGNSEFAGDVNMNGWNIKNLAAPTSGSDAVSKSYVDNAYTAGTGLSLASNVFSINASQQSITSLGTLSTLTVSGATFVRTPQSDTEAANRLYVNTAYLAGTGLVKTGLTFSVSPDLNLSTLSVSGACTVRTPQTGTEIANKSYVDSSFSAGTGLSLTNNIFSINSSQSTITSVGTLSSLNVNGAANFNGNVISNVASPLTGSDVANKTYVDNAVSNTYTAGLGIDIDSGVISINDHVECANMIVHGKATVPTPVDATDSSTKAYVDSAYSAGTGLTSTSRVFSVNAAQPQITSVGTLTALTMAGSINGGGYGITNVANPTNATDVCNKQYVDTVYLAGTGLSKSFTTFSVNAAQPAITSVGTLTSLNVSGAITVGANPVLNSEVTNKSYVDNVYSAGTGLTKVGTMFSVNSDQSQVTKVGTLTSLNVSGSFATQFQIVTPEDYDTITITSAGLVILGSAPINDLSFIFPASPAAGRIIIITSAVDVNNITFYNASFYLNNPTSLAAGIPLRLLFVSGDKWIPV